ncbi:MAG: hypothetical protein LRZ88_06405 [Candidatus Cloacimonetes bacterium]|nr:hypothetical protein [Candidatus Cloacimonadota bacterium]
MAETISQFLKSIEDERKKGLAQKAQALMPYLNQLYTQTREEEERTKQRDIAINDISTMASGAGYDPADIDAWKQSASALRDPNAVRNSWSDHENRIAATGLLKKYGGEIPEGATTNELMRLAKERMEARKRGEEIDNTIQQTTGEGDPNDPDVQLYNAKRGAANRDELEGIEKKAKMLGTAGYKVYQGLIQKGADPYEAYGETVRRLDAQSAAAKADAKGEKVDIGNLKGKAKSRVNEEKDRDGKVLGSFVYWINDKGQKAKSAVYTDGNGNVYWEDTDEQVNLDDVLPISRVGDTSEYGHVKKNPYRSKNTGDKKKASGNINTAEDYIKSLGL